MKGYEMYTKIQQLKEKGFKQNNVAKQLNIHRKTVKRYWLMNADEYKSAIRSVCKSKILDDYERIILEWLKTYPAMSSAQINDWLKEHYKAFFKERTVSRYVSELREKYGIVKKHKTREYEAVDELPPGKQLQVDFGEKYIDSCEGNRIKIRFATFVLSHSRFKYVEFQERPFTGVDLVRACLNCFKYISGIPQELVFDQDTTVCVSENYGDIVHTYEFEKLRQQCKFSVYLCRAADPESKGKIENVVKYVKQNFLQNRLYPGDESLFNQSCLEWLSRTANAKIHGTTKRIPNEMYYEEREYLKPLPDIETIGDTSIYRTVRKDNTIIYESNRYSVPLGTFSSQKEVKIEAVDGKLIISTTFGDYLCEHHIASGVGKLIKSTSHYRDKSSSLDTLQQEISILLNGKHDDFLQKIRSEMSRYARDQFCLIKNLCSKYSNSEVEAAVEFVENEHLYSAVYVKDYLEYLKKPKQKITLLPIPLSDNKYHITTEKRPLTAYARLGGDKK